MLNIDEICEAFFQLSSSYQNLLSVSSCLCGLWFYEAKTRQRSRLVKRSSSFANRRRSTQNGIVAETSSLKRNLDADWPPEISYSRNQQTEVCWQEISTITWSFVMIFLLLLFLRLSQGSYISSFFYCIQIHFVILILSGSNSVGYWIADVNARFVCMHASSCRLLCMCLCYDRYETDKMGNGA